MEIRCGGCNKLFRIPDEKITGKGIKFACTRCGGSVKVTKEEFEQYTLSKSAVSVLDLFEEKPKSAKAPPAPEAVKSATQGPAAAPEEHKPSAAPPGAHEAHAGPVQEHPVISASAAAPETRKPDQTAPSVPDLHQEEPTHPTDESSPSAVPVSVVEDKVDLKPVREPLPTTQEEPHHPEPEKGPIAQPAQAVKSTALEARTEPHPENEQVPKAARHERLAEAMQGSLISSPRPQGATPPHIPQVPPVQGKSVQTAPEIPSRSLNMFLIYSVMLILIVLVGYGVFTFIGPGAQKTDELLKELSSTEGLRIVSASGSVDPKGDLVITCMIENSLNKERPVWYVVVDIYNAQGAVLSKIRSINGKQLYTQRDYDIFSKRGMNIQELKLKNLQDQGVVIPAKGSVTFEMRYLQPANGVTSFNALVHPFDPVRLFKELAEEIQQ